MSDETQVDYKIETPMGPATIVPLRASTATEPAHARVITEIESPTAKTPSLWVIAFNVAEGDRSSSVYVTGHKKGSDRSGRDSALSFRSGWHRTAARLARDVAPIASQWIVDHPEVFEALRIDRVISAIKSADVEIERLQNRIDEAQKIRRDLIAIADGFNKSDNPSTLLTGIGIYR